jgi:hypothetical protein
MPENTGNEECPENEDRLKQETQPIVPHATESRAANVDAVYAASLNGPHRLTTIAFSRQTCPRAAVNKQLTSQELQVHEIRVGSSSMLSNRYGSSDAAVGVRQRTCSATGGHMETLRKHMPASALFNRRGFPTGVGVTLLHASLVRQTIPRSASAQSVGDYPFTLGVASGEPTPDGVVLWTRSLPTRCMKGAACRGSQSPWSGKSRPMNTCVAWCSAAQSSRCRSLRTRSM